MIKYLSISVIYLLSICLLNAQEFKTFEGRIIEADNGTPLPFVRIQVQPSGHGTLTNEDGEFSLNVPTSALDDELVISIIGYSVEQVKLSELPQDSYLEIQLDKRSYQLEEVLITPEDPRDLILKAVSRIEENHPFFPRKMEVFYRQTTAKNDTSFQIGEAVVEAYIDGKLKNDKGTYTSKVRPIKVRKLSNYHPDDSIFQFPIEDAYLQNSLERRPDKTSIGDGDDQVGLKSFLDEEFFKFYEYKLKEITEVDGRNVYVIHFDQNKRFGAKLYQGEIYLDLETLAFARIHFRFSDSGKRFKFTQVEGQKGMGFMRGVARLAGFKFDFLDHYVTINYSYDTEKKVWHKSFVQTGFHFWFRISDWLLNMGLKDEIDDKKERKEIIAKSPPHFTFKMGLEMLITDIGKAESAPGGKEWLKDDGSLFNDERVDNNDPFWENYNYIKPSASLEAMAEKIRASMTQ